jgi:hypothetical protein
MIHLDDDCSRWPKSNEQLLGVTPPFDKSGLRRAYLQLVRKFKPELYPKEFGIIRAAYESLLSQTFDGIRLFQSDSPEIPISGTPTETESETSLTPIDSAWRIAEGGNLADAYSRISARLDLGIEAYRLCLILKFLEPGVDPDRDPVALFYECVERYVESEAVFEFFRTFSNIRFRFALDDRFRKLFRARSSSGSFWKMLKIRWQMAQKTHSYRILWEDYRELVRRVREDDHDSWIPLLFDLHYELLSTPENRFRWQVRDEIDRISNQSLKYSKDFDNLEQSHFESKFSRSKAFVGWPMPEFCDLLFRLTVSNTTPSFRFLDLFLSSIHRFPSRWHTYLTEEIGQFEVIRDRLNDLLSTYEIFVFGKLIRKTHKNSRVKLKSLDAVFAYCYLNAITTDELSARYPKKVGLLIRHDWVLQFILKANQLFQSRVTREPVKQ